MLRFTNKNELNGYWSDARETHFHFVRSLPESAFPWFLLILLAAEILESLVQPLGIGKQPGHFRS